MTSRRSPPRRSSGNSAVLAAWLSLALGAGAALARGDEAVAESGGALHESRGGVAIDWQAGTLAATGGAAADLCMPSVDLSRPGAERRAHAAALAKLRSVLAALPLGGGRTLDAAGIDRALGRARTVDTQYQSNGGAVVRLEVRFADWIERSDPTAVTLTAAAMPLCAAPAARVGGREVGLGAATFRLGAAPPGSHAVTARADRAGNLAIEGGGELAAKLAGAVALIYVQKVQK
jgi:hypothetical protein